MKLPKIRKHRSSSRRWRRLSLRTLMLLVTVFCFFLGFEVNGYRAQRRCVTALLDRDTEGKFWHRSPRFRFPNWLEKQYPQITSLVSVHVQYRLTHVDLAQHYGDVVDVVLEGTATTGSLLEASFSDISWSDSRLRYLSRQKRLRTLEVNGTTDDRLVAAISKLQSLERLSFNCTKVTRDTMLKLRQLTRLNRLHLRGQLDKTTMFDLKAGMQNAYVTLESQR